MLKNSLLFLLTALPAFIFSQAETKEEDYVNQYVLKYDDYIYRPNIRTIRFHEASWEQAAPIISLNSNQQLELTFDDLDGDQKQYSISFVHCNADWTPSDLMISEYLNGFYELNILNFSFAANTLQKYTHYTILFPQANNQMNTQFTKSGNYVMYVYLDGDKKNLAFCRRFLVVDDKVQVTASFRQPVGGGDQYSKQQIDFTVASPNYDMNNPGKDMKVVITQNNRWENAVTDIKPTFSNLNSFTFSMDEASTFRGGNEFRYFDCRSTRFTTERVKSIYVDDKLTNHIVLYPDETRMAKPYLFYNDFNGDFLIRNRETRGNPELEGDYVYVEFFMPYYTPEAKGNFYIMGKLTDWRMNRNSKMTYNYERNGYEAKLYLKQGFYNYMYVLSEDGKKGGNESVMEGSFWDTENDYYIYVYHRKFGTYYDQLLGVKKLNSLKK